MNNIIITRWQFLTGLLKNYFMFVLISIYKPLVFIKQKSECTMHDFEAQGFNNHAGYKAGLKSDIRLPSSWLY